MGNVEDARAWHRQLVTWFVRHRHSSVCPAIALKRPCIYEPWLSPDLDAASIALDNAVAVAHGPYRAPAWIGGGRG